MGIFDPLKLKIYEENIFWNFVGRLFFEGGGGQGGGGKNLVIILLLGPRIVHTQIFMTLGQPFLGEFK